MPAKERPPKDELTKLYVEDGLSAYAIAKHYDVSNNTVKTWLLLDGLYDAERAERNRKNPGPKNQPSTALVTLSEATGNDPEAYLDLLDDCGQPSALDQPDEEDESAFGRLSRRMKRAALIYADLQGDALNDSDYDKAAKIGVDAQTLYAYLKQDDFQQAIIELQTREARFIVKTQSNRDLVRLLKSGTLGPRDRETVLKWLGDLGPDTQINFNQFNGTGRDGRISAF